MVRAYAELDANPRAHEDWWGGAVALDHFADGVVDFLRQTHDQEGASMHHWRAWVVNTQTSSQAGSHWFSVAIGRKSPSDTTSSPSSPSKRFKCERQGGAEPTGGVASSAALPAAKAKPRRQETRQKQPSNTNAHAIGLNAHGIGPRILDPPSAALEPAATAARTEASGTLEPAAPAAGSKDGVEKVTSSALELAVAAARTKDGAKRAGRVLLLRGMQSDHTTQRRITVRT